MQQLLLVKLAGTTITGRFGVQQKSKTRPIDDYKASFVNSSVTQTETASVHTVDHIAALISCVMRTWQIKHLPLSDEAFRLDSHRRSALQATGRKSSTICAIGSVASVTAFLRVAQAIWKLGTKLLHLLWTSHFDDLGIWSAVAHLPQFRDRSMPLRGHLRVSL